ncbi:MAG: flagellar hook-associated protein FlgL [Bdellovibrionota bacterium]
MRVSERQRYETATGRIERAKLNNSNSLNVLATQKRINTLHDDPIAMTQVIKKNSQIEENSSFQRNINFTKGFIETTETALSGIGDRLIRAKELAIAMANDNYDSKSRSATAREVAEIINEVVQLGNSNYNNRFVFSGFRTSSPALSQDGNFLGDDGGIFLQIEDSNYKQINTPGRFLFGPTPDEQQQGHFGLVSSLEVLRDSLNEDDKQGIYKAIDELGFHLDKVSSFQATVGATFNAIDQAQQRLESGKTSLVTRKSELEDADMYKATSDFKRTETVLQSTLLASNKLLQPSLLNFMQ